MMNGMLLLKTEEVFRDFLAYCPGVENLNYRDTQFSQHINHMFREFLDKTKDKDILSLKFMLSNGNSGEMLRFLFRDCFVRAPKLDKGQTYAFDIANIEINDLDFYTSIPEKDVKIFGSDGRTLRISMILGYFVKVKEIGTKDKLVTQRFYHINRFKKVVEKDTIAQMKNPNSTTTKHSIFEIAPHKFIPATLNDVNFKKGMVIYSILSGAREIVEFCDLSKNHMILRDHPQTTFLPSFYRESLMDIMSKDMHGHEIKIHDYIKISCDSFALDKIMGDAGWPHFGKVTEMPELVSYQKYKVLIKTCIAKVKDIINCGNDLVINFIFRDIPELDGFFPAQFGLFNFKISNKYIVKTQFINTQIIVKPSEEEVKVWGLSGKQTARYERRQIEKGLIELEKKKKESEKERIAKLEEAEDRLNGPYKFDDYLNKFVMISFPQNSSIDNKKGMVTYVNNELGRITIKIAGQTKLEDKSYFFRMGEKLELGYTVKVIGPIVESDQEDEQIIIEQVPQPTNKEKDNARTGAE